LHEKGKQVLNYELSKIGNGLRSPVTYADKT